MRRLKLLALFLLIGDLVLLATPFGSAKEYAKHTLLDRKEVREAAALLKSAMTVEDAAERQKLCEKASTLLGKDHFAAHCIEGSLDEENPARAIGKIHESLTFRPWMEAELPWGFPQFTPLHHVEVKKYPRYRLARVDMDRTPKGDSGAFWALFQHIKRNDIEMTAPVQTNFEGPDDGLSKSSMAFLYGTTELGQLGRDRANERVVVEEVEPSVVVSIGMRGEMTAESIQIAHSKLNAWLRSHGDVSSRRSTQNDGIQQSVHSQVQEIL